MAVNIVGFTVAVEVAGVGDCPARISTEQTVPKLASCKRPPGLRNPSNMLPVVMGSADHPANLATEGGGELSLRNVVSVCK